MKLPPDFEEIEIGQCLGSYDYRLTPSRILRHIEAAEDNHPWYGQTSPFGGAFVSPAVCANDMFMLPGFLRDIYGQAADGALTNRATFFHTKTELDFLTPARPNKIIRVSGKVVNKYVKRERCWVVLESLSVDEDGKEILRNRSTLSWLAQEQEGDKK